MGNCCGGSETRHETTGQYQTFRGTGTTVGGAGGGGGGGGGPVTQKDMDARALAAEKAAQRQQQFEQSAVGRAAYTAVKDAKKPVTSPGGGADTSRDWMS
eukprot:CAMPEP_0202897190 /NCGR_PEP_ID=MMETSP1392-20130828/6020_1 /ASSEMBLY_ACC=CAM_ASM_000868 /TAXON_ID=225041 /ORGANISM="Chlamydomonas chlamydogama, Strain SAG 11-48b" /LENGTH=99 /DNA_ID=CAMNT_0049582769 /DNA_START=8 /DNA_END=307 /DNA_ORIENTATION=-